MKLKTLAPPDTATLAKLERTFVWRRAKISHETLASGLKGRRGYA